MQKGQKQRGRERCAFPGAPGAPLLVPLPSSATDVIRYHAFVRVRFRAVRDIKLRKREKERIARDREKERERERKGREGESKKRKRMTVKISDLSTKDDLHEAIILVRKY
ncbi:hypothetical protein ACS0PU_012971 [Formica fusca]